MTRNCRFVSGLATFVSLSLYFAGSGGCAQQRSEWHPPLALREIPVPAKVYSIAGEVRAFAVVGGREGRRGRADASVADLQKRFGAFRTGRAMVFDAKGRVLAMKEVAVDPGGEVMVEDAAPGQRVLFFPDVNERFRATYGVLCKLSRADIPAQMVPRICQQILCLDQPFRASELTKRVPGLEKHVQGLGDDMIGGIDVGGGPRPVGPGGGNICDQCLPRGVVFPEPECSDAPFVPAQAGCGDGDRVVFVRREPGSTNTQIRIMRGTGADEEALTAGDANDRDPDVSLHDGRVVFVRHAGGSTSLFTVGVDGTGLAEVPGTAGATSPSWGRGPESFLVFTMPAGASSQTAIFRAGPGGGAPVQVTFPPDGRSDDQAAVVDAKDVLFTRSGSPGRQLFIQATFDGASASPVQLTNIGDAAVNFPVAFHVRDDELFAFVADRSAFQEDEIRVCRFNVDRSGFDLLHAFVPAAPFDHNVTGLDFSSDDECLFFSAITSGVGGLPDERVEMYGAGLDGFGQTRLTTNEGLDGSPGVITQ